MRQRITGYCPMGCGETLIRDRLLNVVPGAPIGAIRCNAPDCPRPTAVAEILADPETEHVVVLDHGGFSVKHPLRERLDDELLGCWLGKHVAEFGPQYLAGGVFDAKIMPYQPYRVTVVGTGEDATTDWEPV
jgi:hypothetical protein